MSESFAKPAWYVQLEQETHFGHWSVLQQCPVTCPYYVISTFKPQSTCRFDQNPGFAIRTSVVSASKQRIAGGKALPVEKGTACSPRAYHGIAVVADVSESFDDFAPHKVPRHQKIHRSKPLARPQSDARRVQPRFLRNHTPGWLVTLQGGLVHPGVVPVGSQEQHETRNYAEPLTSVWSPPLKVPTAYCQGVEPCFPVPCDITLQGGFSKRYTAQDKDRTANLR